jgi:DNA-binding beta-propeller fold protein YncE
MRITPLLLLILSLPVSADSKVILVAGGGSPGSSSLEKPFGVDIAPDRTIYVIDFSGKLLALTPDGKLATICGGVKGDSGDGGPAKDAKLNSPHAIAITKNGDIYVADSFNSRVRRIDAKTHVITTVAGTTKGFSGDGGPASKAQFSGIYCIALNPDQSKLVLTDLDNHRIRVMDLASGIVTTVAGNGQRGLPKDGAKAIDQPLVDPRAAVMDSKGNVYVLERNGNALRVVDPAGTIRTVIAGSSKKGEKSELAGPKHLCVDANDDVYVADTDHHRIIKWLAKEQRIVPVAGTGKVGSGGVGGPPEKVELSQPHGVYVGKDGIYVSDSFNGRVLKIVRQ